jgi:hypothetical protein
MSIEAYITIAVLSLTFVLLIKTKIPSVAVFVGALTMTITFRVAPLEESLKGFSNSGMLTIGVLLMVAAGMYRTGAITLITEKLIGRPKSLLAAQMDVPSTPCRHIQANSKYSPFPPEILSLPYCDCCRSELSSLLVDRVGLVSV